MNNKKIKTNIKVRRYWKVNPATNIIMSKKDRIKHKGRFIKEMLDE
jgi:hypothetical protein